MAAKHNEHGHTEQFWLQRQVCCAYSPFEGIPKSLWWLVRWENICMANLHEIQNVDGCRFAENPLHHFVKTAHFIATYIFFTRVGQIFLLNDTFIFG
jgi:hypothetical protein